MQGRSKKDTDKAIAFAADDKAFKEWLAKGARLHHGQTPTVKDKIMAEEAAEFLAIATKIIGVDLNESKAKDILRFVTS